MVPRAAGLWVLSIMLDGYVSYPVLKGEKIRDQGNVNAPSPHLSQNETPLWLPFSSTHVECSGKGRVKRSTFSLTNCMKSCPGFSDKRSELEERERESF